jgi:hypothetical protein
MKTDSNKPFGSSSSTAPAGHKHLPGFANATGTIVRDGFSDIPVGGAYALEQPLRDSENEKDSLQDPKERLGAERDEVPEEEQVRRTIAARGGDPLSRGTPAVKRSHVGGGSPAEGKDV